MTYNLGRREYFTHIGVMGEIYFTLDICPVRCTGVTIFKIEPQLSDMDA